MTTRNKIFTALLSLGLLALLSGCPTTQTTSSIPWSRPATWEGQVPGMSSSAVTR